MTGSCRCGHPAAMHEHLRDGNDCGRCGPVTCPSYRSDMTLIERVADVAAWAAWSVLAWVADRKAGRR